MEIPGGNLMTGKRSTSRVLIMAALLASGVSSRAQSTTPSTDLAISKLAAGIAKPLQKSRAKKVVVADLLGPDGQKHPAGRYLAVRLSESLQKEYPKLEVIERPKQEAGSNDGGDPEDKGVALEKAKDWARKLGANVVITGSLAKISQGIGVSLSAVSSQGSERMFGQANGLIPFTDQIAGLSPDSIPEAKGGILRAGVGGTGVPTCIYCPAPEYTDEARSAKLEGAVTLLIVVNLQGRAENISVVKGPGHGLEENAIKAVKKWKFKPATGADGNPVAVIVPIEVTYRWYQ